MTEILPVSEDNGWYEKGSFYTISADEYDAFNEANDWAAYPASEDGSGKAVMLGRIRRDVYEQLVNDGYVRTGIPKGFRFGETADETVFLPGGLNTLNRHWQWVSITYTQ